MQERTCAAIRELVLALRADYESVSTLENYGNLPEHLLDVCHDYDLGDSDPYEAY